MLGIAEGLGYLHSCNVIHGDLKGVRTGVRFLALTLMVTTQANILVDAAGNARIVDFGLATVARDSKSLTSTTDEQGITARYTAPEILKGLGCHSKESDVFAFGMVITEVGGHGSLSVK